MPSTKHTAHIIRYMPPTGTPHKSQNQLVVRHYNTYLVQPRQTGTTCRGNRVVQHKAKRQTHSVRDISAKTILRSIVLHPIATRRNQTVPYICNRVGTVSSCCGTRCRTHRRDGTGVHVPRTVTPLRRGEFRFRSAPIGEIAPGVSKKEKEILF